jgi:P pilus assembly chaperone PapD
MRYKFLTLPLVFVSCLAQAQDASLLAGGMRVDQDPDDTSFAVALGYIHHINR